MKADSTRPPAPAGLSTGNTKLWEQLVEDNVFSSHELPALAKSLTWDDRAAQWLEESEGATGREQAQLRKQAMDASQMSLRFWRTLKFTDPDNTSRDDLGDRRVTSGR